MRTRSYLSIALLISLIVFFGCSKDDKTEEPIPAPVAGFNYSGAGVPAPAVVIFTNTSTNASSFLWDFGDNATSTEKDPQHTYIAGGVYTVNLTATGSGGSNSISKTVNIQTPVGPIANFTFTGNGIQAPCVVTFTNTSEDASTYSWDFGDGQTSTSENPTHTYTTGGNFNVQLTVTGNTGSNSITKSVGILNPPTVCKITNVSILSCPLTDGGGTSWDGFSGPDFYFNLETTLGTILIDGSGSYYEDYASFPQSWTINPTYNFSNTNWNTAYKIHIWEHDSPDADDNVSSVNFTLNSYTTVTNHYPSQFTITSGITQVKLTVQWQ
jgi:PKD repeat protein